MNDKVLSHSDLRADMDGDEIDLGEYLAVLLDSRWLITFITLLALMIGVFTAWVMKPVYHVDAMLQVEDNGGSSIGGLSELSMLMGEAAPSEAEIEIIRSRKILGTVVDQLHLDVLTSPVYFPLIGEPVARRHPQLSFIGFDSLGGQSYAWGDESAIIDSFEVSQGLENQLFYIENNDNNGYQLYDKDANLIATGTVGEPLVTAQIQLFISLLHISAGKRLKIQKTSRFDAISNLQGNLSVKEKGKQTGILSLSLESTRPEIAKNILDAVANVYLRQNVERKSAEAQKSIEFLAGQLPEVKASMDAAESILNEFRLKQGSVNLKLETQSILDRVVEVENALSSLDMQMEDIRSRFTSNHPVMQTMISKRQRLQSQKTELTTQVKALPEKEQQILRLTRDVKVNSELYTFLLNKHQELKVVKAGTIGNVRIIDYANLPSRPIKPKKMLIVLLATIAGFMAAILLVFIRQALNKAIEDPEELEHKLGLPVYAAIPHSDEQIGIDGRVKKEATPDKPMLLAALNPDDQAIESLRSLRTNLHFALMEAKNNIVMITGPSPGIGKSFVSANFAHVLTQMGRKVLLVDADMRKGHLNHFFGIERSPGLSELISEGKSLSECSRTFYNESFHFIPTGNLPPNPSELLMHENFNKFMEEASYLYDVVIIDTPPVLAVTDAMIIGKHAASCFMLLRSGKHQLAEVRQTLEYLNRSDITVNGVIFNDMPHRPSYYSYGKYYRYNYTYKKS